MSNSKYVWENDETHSGYDYNGSKWKRDQLTFLFDFIEQKFSFKESGMKYLDIGCNAALNLKTFKGKFPNENNEYYGFDLNDTSLSLAKSNIPEGKFKKCNFLLENPLEDFEDNFFDICSVTWVLSHLNASDARETLIKEMVRTSKRGIIYEAWAPQYCTNIENLPYTKGNEKEYNVVVFDSYTSYSDHIKFEQVVKKSSSVLYYWDKTSDKKN